MPLTRPRHYSPEISEEEKMLSSREHTTEWVSYALIPDSITLREVSDTLVFEFDYPVREEPEEAIKNLDSGAKIQIARSSRKLLKVWIPHDDHLEERLERLSGEIKQFGSECYLDSVKRSYEMASKFFEDVVGNILNDLHRNRKGFEDNSNGRDS